MAIRCVANFPCGYVVSTISSIVKVHSGDDGRTGEFRQETDKAAPIRDIWKFLNQNLAKNYEPQSCITIDEPLFPYRGRTKFTQFIPSNLAKYGIKVWWACDSKTKYPLQGILYTGKAPGEQREINQGENVLLELASRYRNSGRTIVADNFFTTLEGAKKLANLGLAYVGTVRANKRCIPEEMKKTNTRAVLSSIFGFQENLVSICSSMYPRRQSICCPLFIIQNYAKVRPKSPKLFYFTIKTNLASIRWIKW